LSSQVVAAAGAGLDRSSSSASVEITERSAGHVEVRGALVFATARHARQEGLRVISAADAGQGAIDIDCSGVTASDSAGLTVLLDWLSCARKTGRSLSLSNLPPPILAVAKISDVEELLISPK
jgi:phospholipid transport system transporter-binding protein